jgi:hypothetical protein
MLFVTMKAIVVIHTWQYAYLFRESDPCLKENLHQEQSPDDQLLGLSMFLPVPERPVFLKSTRTNTAEK